MDTMTQPDPVEVLNQAPRVGGHSTVHTSAQNDFDFDRELQLDDFYVPTQPIYDLDHQGIEAIETDVIHDGPPKWAGRLAVLFGLVLVIAATVAAVTNVMGLLQNPPTITTVAAEADDTEEIVEEDIEPVAEEAPSITVGTAITGSRIRSAPSQTAETIGSIEGGDTVEITGDPQNGWYPVTYQGITGWTYGQLLTDIHTTGGTAQAAEEPSDEAADPAATDQRTMVAQLELNLRSGPSTAYPPNGVVPQGATVVVTGEPQNGWYPVSYGGLTGFLRPEYLSAAN